MELVTRGMDEEGEGCLGGDLNASMGEEGGPIRESGGGEENSRRSRDKTVNKEGKILIEKIINRGWMILNCSYDREGGCT